MLKPKVLAAALLIVMPTANVALARGGGKSKPAPEPPTETRVYVRSQCLLGEKEDLHATAKIGLALFPALAAIFIPLLIEKALGGLGAALKKAGSEETLKDSGRLPTYLYYYTREKKIIPNTDLGCVIAVRGTFSAPDPETPPNITYSEKGVFTNTDDVDEARRLKRLNDNGINVRDIAVVYEAKMTPSDDSTALLYEAKFFEAKRFQGGRSSDRRGLVVSIAIIGAGEKEGEPVLSLGLMNMGEVTARQHKDKNKSTYTVSGPEQLKGRRGSWLGRPGISDASLNAVAKMSFPEVPTDKNHPAYKKFLGVMPITIEATFAETDDGNKALKFIGEVLDATKGSVAKALSSEILEGDKRATEAADAAEKLLGEEEAAYAGYLKAKAAYCALGIINTEKDITTADIAKLKKADNVPLTVTERGQVFEFQRARRAWRLKFDALEKLGVTPSGRDPNDLCEL